MFANTRKIFQNYLSRNFAKKRNIGRKPLPDCKGTESVPSEGRSYSQTQGRTGQTQPKYSSSIVFLFD